MTLGLAVYLTAWSILALNTLAAGPGVRTTVTAAIGSGRAAGLSAAFAAGLGCGLWGLGMALVLAAVVSYVPGSQEALTIMAAGLLIYFAFDNLRTAVRFSGDPPLRGAAGLKPRSSAIRTLTAVVTSPRALTTWLAILCIFPIAQASNADVAHLTLAAVATAAAIHAIYAWLFSMPNAARLYPRVAPVISGAVGAFFAGLAVKHVAPLLATL